jgi:hypothetical protein
MSPWTSPAIYDHVAERRRAVALARHLREAEGLSISQIDERLGRSPDIATATVSGNLPRQVELRTLAFRR